MNAEVQWLAYYLQESGRLDRQKCQILSKRLPADTTVEAFGKALLGTRLCDDPSQVEKLISFAKQRAEGGEGPLNNPFADSPATSDQQPTANAPAAQRSPAHRETQPSPPKPQSAPSKNRSRATFVPKPRPARSPAAQEPAAQEQSPQPPRKAANRVATRKVAAPAEHIDSVAPAAPPPSASPLRSREMPRVSLYVPAEMPNFDAMGTLNDEDLRESLVQLLLACQNEGISDLHLSAGARPFARKSRTISFLSDSPLDPSVAERLNTSLLSEQQRFDLDEKRDLDYALALSAHDRFRVNLMLHKNGLAGTYRVVSKKISTLEELGFESTESLEKLLSYHNGLILVTGPVGSGKTTTLAALVDKMNRTRKDHIITVEEPIEIVQSSDQCQLTQREVGSHTKSFRSALKGALRQDPDIIVIGEMRDLETIEMAISASETGHLVIGTMHTSDAATTLNRLLDVFPPAQQAQIRAMVSESLRGILCQRQLPTKDGGVALASEILLNNTAVKSLIRENKIEGLPNVIETGIRQGMQLMDKSVMKLWNEGKISGDTALENLVSAHLKRQITSPPPASDPDPEPARKKKLFS